MQQWEYASILNDGPASRDTLNELGSQGWELVTVIQGAQTLQLLYIFKRLLAVATADATVAEPA